MNEIGIQSDQNSLLMYFHLQDSWDDFEDIVELLQRYFNASIEKRVDGAESKFVILNIGDSELVLINNPYGNTLKASTNAAKSVLKEIHNSWNKYSKL